MSSRNGGGYQRIRDADAAVRNERAMTRLLFTTLLCAFGHTGFSTHIAPLRS
jgi:hypothetical protein